MYTKNCLDDINRAIPLATFLEPSRGGLYCCPWCGSGHGPHGTGAVSVDEKKHVGYCNSCEQGFNLIQLVEKVEGLDFNDAVTLIAERSGSRLEYDDDPPARDEETIDDVPPIEDARGAFEDYIRACHAAVGQTDYFHRRGLTDETIDENYLGWDAEKQMIVIPYPFTHYGYWVRRNLAEDKAEREIRKPKGIKEPLFGAPLLDESDPCFIVEGQLDALSIKQAGGHAVALGNKGKNRLIKRLEDKAPAAPLILCLDDDPPGRAAQAELRRALDELGTPYTIARFDREAYAGASLKDANDLLRANPAAFEHDIERNIYRTADPAELANDPTGLNAFLTDIYSDRYRSTSTGIKEVDDLLQGGFIPQTLVMLGAEPGAGKTALTSMIFETMAAAGHPSLVFNLEMSREQLIARSIARRIYIDTKGDHVLTGLDILQGFKHTEPTRELVHKVARAYRSEVADRMQYNPGKCDSDLDKILEYITKRADQAIAADKPAPNIAVDYLQLLTSSKREDPVEIIKRAIAGLKEYAVKYSAIVFCVTAQSRRANESTSPMMTAGRDTSAIEYSADLLLQLIHEFEDFPDVLTLYVNKSRFTRTTRLGEGCYFTLRGGQAYLEPFHDLDASGAPTSTDKKRLERV